MTVDSPVSLDAIGKQKEHIKDKKADDKDSLEKLSAEKNRLAMEKDSHDQLMKDRQADRKLRSDYADKIIKFLQMYASVVALFVFLHALKITFKLPDDLSCGSDDYYYFLCDFSMSFELPTEVLIALVGSTAIASIGLVGFVAQGLFGKKQ